MIHFVGAGPGAVDLITVRGAKLLKKADVIIYAGSLVNPELLKDAREDAEIHNSAEMTLEQVLEVMIRAEKEGRDVVRLHTGDAGIYGAIREQMDRLDEEGIPYDTCPGVTACFGAAAALDLEFTLPGVTQTLIITRREGKTAVPEKEKLKHLAMHQASMAIYLSASMLREVSEELMEGGYPPDTPAALVCRATWEDEKKVICTVASLEEAGRKNGIDKVAVILIGKAVQPHGEYERSRLYSPDFGTAYRPAKGTAE